MWKGMVCLMQLFTCRGMVPVHVCKAFRVKARSLHAQDLAIVCHTAHQQWSIKKSFCGLIKNIRSAQLPQRIEIWLLCWVNSTNASVKMSREYQAMKNKNPGGTHWRMQLTESRNSSLAVKFHTMQTMPSGIAFWQTRQTKKRKAINWVTGRRCTVPLRNHCFFA